MEILIYHTSEGRAPFYDWLDKLDTTAKSIISARLKRIELGNFGDAKIIIGGDGVWELRIHFGPGYRIYFGKINNVMIVVLAGGDKGSQVRDITRAGLYWYDYLQTIKEILND